MHLFPFLDNSVMRSPKHRVNSLGFTFLWVRNRPCHCFDSHSYFFFSEQPLYGNYSTLNSHTNTVISQAVTYSSRWRVGKLWLTTSFPLIRKTGQRIYQQRGPTLSNRTKPNKKPIEPNRTPIVRLGWAIEQNRTPILLWVRFSNQSNQYNRTKSNKIELIQCNCLLTPQTE